MENSKELVFICQVFHPDTTSTSQLFSPLIVELERTGWKITVLCGFPANQEKQAIPKQEVWQNITIQRCGFAIALKASFLHRALAYFSFLVEAGIRLVLTPYQSVWFGVTNPPFCVWLLGLGAILKNKKFLFIFLDLYPDGLVMLNHLQENQILVRLWRKCNGWAYQRAEKISNSW